MADPLLVTPYDEIPTSLDADVQVRLTLRPLASVLPAAWQRFLRSRLHHPYETWLEAVLSDPPADWPTVTSFWQRHHYDALVDRWVSVVGPERVVVAVVDSVDDSLLSASRAELLRRVNVAFHHRDWPVERYQRVVRRGVLRAIEQQSSGPAIVTPAWAVKRANQIALADAERIGVPVDGDLSVRVGRVAPPPEMSALPLEDAVAAVVAAVDAVAATWPE